MYYHSAMKKGIITDIYDNVGGFQIMSWNKRRLTQSSASYMGSFMGAPRNKESIVKESN